LSSAGVILESSYQKFTKDFLIIGLASLLNAMSGIIFLPLITKTLGANDYGIWVQVQTIIGLVMEFVGLGLPYTLSRFLAAKTSKDEIQEEFWSVFSLVSLVTLVVSIIFIALAGFIAQAFFEGYTIIVIVSGLIILILSLNITILGLFRALRQMKKYALFTIASTYGQLSLITFLVLTGFGILQMILAVLAVNLIIFLVLFISVKQQTGIKRPHFLRIRDYLKFGLPTIPGNISTWIVYSSDRLIIAHFLGATSVGVYSAAYSLGSLPILITSIFGLILPPTLSRLFDEGKIDELRTTLSYSLKYALFFTIPFVSGAIFLSVPVLNLFSTPEIAVQGNIILILVAINSLVLVCGGMVSQILIPIKKTGIIGLAWSIAAIINLGLNLLLVPQLGILGSAISTLIAYLVAEIIQMFTSLRKISFPLDWTFVIKSLISSALMSLIIWIIHPMDSIRTLVTIAIGFTIYITAMIILRGFKKEEIKLFTGLVRQIFASNMGNNKEKGH
jgi:O-antigen/teichoic acid export membrane protein